MSGQSLRNATPTGPIGFEIPVGPSPIRLGDPNAPRSGEGFGTPPGFDPVWGTLGAPAAQAEDLAQEAMLSLWRKAHLFDPAKASVGTWVFTIAMHLVQHYFRTHARKPGDRASAKGTEIQALVDQRENGPAKQVERMESYDALDQVLGQLDEGKRLVFVLAELEQLTLVEIGEIVGANPNTVATRLRAARQAFEKALARFQTRELGSEQ